MEQAILFDIREKQNNVYQSIEMFLDSVGLESENTKNTYRTAIKDFFLATRNKELEYLTVNDLQFTYIEVEQYRHSIIGKYKNSTVNTKMVAVKKLFDKLNRYDIQVNSSAFNLDKLKEYDTESYDMLTIEEVNKSMDIVSKTNNGYEKKLLIKLAFSTAFRKSVLINLKWDSIYESNGGYYIKVLGKGNKWSTKKIDSDLYKELMEYKKITYRENVFNLSSSTVQRMMDKIKSEIDFGNRVITFHSFKKASIEEMGIQTNFDLKAMQRHGDHSDVSTTLNIYVAQKDVENMPTLSTDIKKVDTKALFDLTKEEIIGIIDSVDRESQIKIMDLVNKKGGH